MAVIQLLIYSLFLLLPSAHSLRLKNNAFVAQKLINMVHPRCCFLEHRNARITVSFCFRLCFLGTTRLKGSEWPNRWTCMSRSTACELRKYTGPLPRWCENACLISDDGLVGAMQSERVLLAAGLTVTTNHAERSWGLTTSSFCVYCAG